MHPAFRDQVVKLVEAVLKERQTGRGSGANLKLLAAITHLIFADIPADPADPKYRQGGTLGPKRKHWFRAKFGNGRFRLFFRYSTTAKVIVFAWVNDRDTLRTRGEKTDAYAVFRDMLNDGNPPDDWGKLVRACEAAGATGPEEMARRIRAAMGAAR